MSAASPTRSTKLNHPEVVPSTIPPAFHDRRATPSCRTPRSTTSTGGNDR